MKDIRDMTDAEFEQATKEREARKKAQVNPWPRKLVMYAHTGKVLETDEGNKFAREGWGLAGPPREFWHIGAELKLTFEVAQDGSSKLVEINGKPWCDE